MRTQLRTGLIVLSVLFLITLSGDWLGRTEAQSTVQTLRTATVDTRDATMTHANFVRVHDTTEEFILDFGTNDEAPAPPKRAIEIDQRIVLSPYTAKRLMIAMEVTVGSYERTFGTIETDPAKRVKPQP